MNCRGRIKVSGSAMAGVPLETKLRQLEEAGHELVQIVPASGSLLIVTREPAPVAASPAEVPHVGA